MIRIKREATVAAISELRAKSEEVLSDLKRHNVIIARHTKPIAIMIDFKRYELQEKLLDFAEDYILGMMALERDKKGKKGDFVDIEEW